MSGDKLLAFVIWKGVWKDCKGMLLTIISTQQHQICSKAQEWLDSSANKQWVREVVVPYLNGREGYLLQDSFSFSVYVKGGNVSEVQHACWLNSLSTHTWQKHAQDIQALLLMLSWLTQQHQNAKPIASLQQTGSETLGNVSLKFALSILGIVSRLSWVGWCWGSPDVKRIVMPSQGGGGSLF